MSNQFRESDAQILSNIIQYANERYLRQSRINKKSSFNILRVLSAYKQTSQQYMLRKQQIYNWIIYITKNFNPQTYKQWIHAINQINQVSRKSSKSLVYHKNSQQGRHINKTVNQFYHHEDSVEYANMSMNAYGTQMSGYLVRDFPAKNKCKQFKCNSNQDYLQLAPPVSSKMHYISFEPEHENKQNLHSGNTHKSEHMKLDNQPTRTPCEQSFIHNLPMSYGSPFVLSKITNNTKDITQIQDEEEQTEQWVNMKTRADVFHQINLKMKSFSALLANFQAFQIFQQLHKKMKKFQKSLFYSRFMNSMEQFIIQKDQKRYFMDKSSKFYELGLMKKGFKILYVLYQLKIHSPNRKQINISKFNTINFQFLLSTIFYMSNQQQQFFQRNDTPKSLRHKSKYFQEVEDFQKMEIISEYFSCNVKLNKQQIYKLFQMHNKARKIKIFNILKNSIRNFQPENEKIKILMKKSAIKDMLKVHQVKFQSKGRITIMKINRNMKLLSNCFKGLLQIILSKKIYTKRQQYLTNKHKHGLMKNILFIWKNRKQEYNLKKLSTQARVQQSTHLVTNLICKKYLKEIIGDFLKAKLKQVQETEKKNLQLCNKVFSFLKTRVKQRQIHSKIKQLKKKNHKKQLFYQWNKMHKINQAVLKINKIMTKQVFIMIRQQTLLQYKQKCLKNTVKNNVYLKGLKQMRICFNLDKQEILNKFENTQKIVSKYEIAVFVRICRFNIKIRKQQEFQQQRKCKMEILKCYIQKKKSQQFITKLKQVQNYNDSLKNKQIILKSAMGSRSFQITKINQQSKQILTKTFVRCHKSMKLEAFDFLKQILLQNVKCNSLMQKIIHSRNNFITQRLIQWKQSTGLKKKLSTIKLKSQVNMKKQIFNSFKKVYQNISKKENQSIQKYKKSLYFKSLLSMAKKVIESSNLMKSLQQFLLKHRKNYEGRRLINNLKIKKYLSQKKQLLMKTNLMLYLKSNKIKKDSLKEKANQLQKFLKLKIMKALLKNKHMKIYNSLAIQFEEEAYKRFAVMKVNKAVIRHILKKKELFMAIKFKANHLCQLGFKGLLMNMSTAQNNENVEQSRDRKFRLHQHISTSYSSL